MERQARGIAPGCGRGGLFVTNWRGVCARENRRVERMRASATAVSLRASCRGSSSAVARQQQSNQRRLETIVEFMQFLSEDITAVLSQLGIAFKPSVVRKRWQNPLPPATIQWYQGTSNRMMTATATRALLALLEPTHCSLSLCQRSKSDRMALFFFHFCYNF